MEGNRHDILEQKMCKELELLEQRYSANTAEMSIQDLDKIDKLYHALKSMATYHAMKDAEEYEQGGFSGRRGRAANGQYVSRDGGDSYHEGYANGYSEAMSQMMNGGNSGGHMYPQRYPRW